MIIIKLTDLVLSCSVLPFGVLFTFSDIGPLAPGSNCIDGHVLVDIISEHHYLVHCGFGSVSDWLAQ